jgi:hypothetical protein
MKKKVAIVIPTHKSRLNTDDLISLRHLRRHLSKYDRFFVIPDDVDEKNFKQKNTRYIKFPKHFFSSWRGYNELLLQEDFYKKFEDYEYILIYQLDVLVFSDQLLYWVKKGYDYIAAPWFRPVIGSLTHKKGCPSSGGNGGFSLRKVSSALKVLKNVNSKATRSSKKDKTRKLWFIQALLKRKTHGVWLNAPADNYPFAEDGFWSLEAPKYTEGYKVAEFDEALKFAFERYPQRCFKLNGNNLPFGVHAWKKYDVKFWKPYILKK